MSGHNKWAQIKHKKAITDAKKGQLFSKLVKEITVAARTGGATPDINTRLRAALERAKQEGLPKENIERAMSRAAGTQEGSSLQEFLYEATLSGGVMMLIEGITDNKNRSSAEIKHILSLFHARFADQGSLIWNFEKTGTLEIILEKNSLSLEELGNRIIESGARDFEFFDAYCIVETDFSMSEVVRQYLEKVGVVLGAIGHSYKAKNPLIVSKEEEEKLAPLIEELLSCDDVQEMYSNIA